MNIAEWLRRTSEITPDRPALFLGQRMVADYGAFHMGALRVAGWLRAQGIAPGERVAIFMKNCPDYLILLYGIWYAGAAAVPINAKLHPREVDYILEDSGARVLFASSELELPDTDVVTVSSGSQRFARVMTHAPADHLLCRAPDDLAWLFYTSGTTGKPKGVMITHHMLLVVSLSYPLDVDQVTGEDAAIYAAPLSHGAGLYNMIHVRVGARHVCPDSGGFDPAEIFALARHFGNAHMFAAPTMVKRMTLTAKAQGETGQGLRTIVYAGGPMYLADIVEAVDHFGPIFVQIYGQGECPMGITALSRSDVSDRAGSEWQSRLASVGRAQSGITLRIADDQGAALPAGQIGEILVRGTAVMPGYWNNRKATAQTLKGGWLHTGDMGRIDDTGYLTLQDRAKDMIITGGSNVYPREVEEILLTHPDVQEVSVVGRTHPDWGEEVVAFVVGTAAAEALDALCLKNIARFKRPKSYIPITALPKNNYGKVLKTELRALLLPE